MLGPLAGAGSSRNRRWKGMPESNRAASSNAEAKTPFSSRGAAIVTDVETVRSFNAASRNVEAADEKTGKSSNVMCGKVWFHLRFKDMTSMRGGLTRPSSGVRHACRSTQNRVGHDLCNIGKDDGFYSRSTQVGGNCARPFGSHQDGRLASKRVA